MVKAFAPIKENDYDSYGNKTTIAVIVIYTLLTTVYNLLFYGVHDAGIRLFSGLFLLLFYTALRRYARVSKRAFAVIVPLSFVLTETVVTVMLNGNRLYFMFLVGCVATCLSYLDTTGLVCFIGIANAIAFTVVFILNIPVLGSTFDTTYHAIQLVAFNFTNLLFYSICSFSVGKFKAFEDTSQTFDMIMETTPNYLIIINDKARVEYISRSLAQWLGLSQREYATDRPLLDLFRWDELRMVFQDAMETGTYVERNFECTIDDKKYWFILRSPLIGDRKIARVFELSDVTPIMEAKIEAEAATLAKSSFLANMSHEIRTPMNAIVGFTELMMMGPLNIEQTSHAMAIKSSSMSLLGIINDILDFSKIDAQKMEIIEKPFDFASLINDTINIISIKAESAGIVFTVFVDSNIPSHIIGDELRIKQVLLNILNNAVKFTRQGCVSLHALVEEVEGDDIKLCFSVSDTGIGIKSEDMNRLFGEFQQVDTRKDRSIEGTGLGLAISRQLVDLMGGTISVESVYGKGSTFSFYFICKSAHTSRIAHLLDPKSCNVLCYEPDNYHAKAMQSALESLGVPYTICSKLQKFEKTLSQGGFTHVFLDKSACKCIDNPKVGGSACFVVMKGIHDTVLNHPSAIPLNRPLMITSIADILQGVYGSAQDTCKDNDIKLGAFKAKNTKVLLVDDNSVNLTVAEGLLRQYGIGVVTAASGQEAIDKARSGEYDMIFMDHMMPGIDGVDATGAIRAQGGHNKTVPIIALTANAVSGASDIFLEAGMNGFLPKPIVISKLHNILLEFLPPENVILEA